MCEQANNKYDNIHTYEKMSKINLVTTSFRPKKLIQMPFRDTLSNCILPNSAPRY